jgi:hypothetical protein
LSAKRADHNRSCQRHHEERGEDAFSRDSELHWNTANHDFRDAFPQVGAADAGSTG